jgi:hypothetical protein
MRPADLSVKLTQNIASMGLLLLVRGRMQLYSYQVSLRIWHPSVDPAIITGKLGLQPSITHRAGERRQTPKGRALDGTYAESYWHSDPFAYGEISSTDQVAEDVLSEVCQRLEPYKQFLVLLREQGARLHLQISSFGTRNYAFESSPQLLAACSTLGLSLVHDVYACAQN